MSAPNKSKQADSAVLSFVDTYGATVTIPADGVQDYTGIKVEQLRAVTQLLASAASGGIELSPSATRDFTLMANSLAHEVEDLLGIAAMAAAENAEGGGVMATEQTKDASFKDLHCAAVTVPAERIALYATIKTEQLSVLSRLVADQTAGYALELSENDVSTLAGLVEELAHINKAMMLAFTLESPEHQKGGV